MRLTAHTSEATSLLPVEREGTPLAWSGASEQGGGGPSCPGPAKVLISLALLRRGGRKWWGRTCSQETCLPPREGPGQPGQRPACVQASVAEVAVRGLGQSPMRQRGAPPAPGSSRTGLLCSPSPLTCPHSALDVSSGVHTGGWREDSGLSGFKWQEPAQPTAEWAWLSGRPLLCRRRPRERRGARLLPAEFRVSSCMHTAHREGCGPAPVRAL